MSRKDRKFNRNAPKLVVLGLTCFSTAVVAEDVINLSLEQLLEVKVMSASRYEQKSSEIAGSPQLIKADEIRASGARNLGEALSLFSGVHLHNDGLYTRLGVRGFLRTGDFNARILLLLDGRRLNELAYDGAYLGEEGPIDVSLIERLEFIPGPGSSVYGSNAFFGVINIITKKNSGQPAAEVAFEIADRNKQRHKSGLALEFDHGGSALLQVSRYESQGRQRGAQELERPGSAMPAGRDKEWANRFYGRYDVNGLSLSAAYVNRGVNTANGAYFSQPNAVQPNRDRLVNVAAVYIFEATPALTLSTHLGASEYVFKSYNLTEPVNGATTDNVQVSHANWVDADIKAVAKWRPDSTLVAGFEVTRASSLAFEVISPSMQKSLVDQQRKFTRWGLYAQNDFMPTPAFTLSLGLRLDGQTARDTVLSPRLGAVYRATATSALKLQHGVAFRNPNAYELYYNAPEIGYRTNPSLRAERVTSNELTFEQEIGQGASLRISGFNNKVDKLIDFIVDPADGVLVFSNTGSTTVNGVQIDLTLVQRDGWRARVGATFQQGKSKRGGAVNESSVALTNSPRSLAQVALYTPKWRGFSQSSASIFGSINLQYVGAQQGREGAVGGYSVVNVTAIADEFWPGFSTTLGLKNMFDRSYGYPLGEEFLQASERGGVRSFWLGAKYSFR